MPAARLVVYGPLKMSSSQGFGAQKQKWLRRISIRPFGRSSKNQLLWSDNASSSEGPVAPGELPLRD
jgi:hypothetical protein